MATSKRKKIKQVNSEKRKSNKTDRDEARDLSAKIIKGTKANQRTIYDFCDGKHFIHLGFDSLKEWALKNQDKLGRSYDSINNDYHTACITVDMCGENNIGKFTPYALLQLKKEEPESRKKLYELAKKRLNKKELTSNDLTKSTVSKYMIELDLKKNESHEKNTQVNKNSHSLSQSEAYLKFNKALQSAKSDKFAKRIAIAVKKTITKKNILHICIEILPEEGTQEIKNQLQKLID